MAEHEHKEGEKHGGEGHGGGGHGHGGGGHGHGGGGHEEHEGVPEWMISFADNTALMMGLFVILLAMNMGPKASPILGGNPSNEEFEGNNARMLDWALGIREAFNNPVSIDSTNPREAQLVQRLKQRKNPGMSHTSAPEGDAQNQQSVRPTDYTDIGGTVTFEDGSCLLGSAAKQTLTEVAEHIKGARWIVEIRGHVSPSETMHNTRKGMELSFDRARAVAEQLVAQGVKWEQLRLGAAGDNERKVARTYDREEDRTNQRVEIIMTKETLPSDPYSKGAADAKGAPEQPAPAPAEPAADEKSPAPEPH